MVTIEQHVWGMTPEGEAIILYTMRNDKGAEVKLSNFGAAIVSVTMPDREGCMADVVLGYKHPEGYFFDGAASGKSVGRCANRIAFGQMTVEGKEYRLEVNNGVNHLHGGTKNFANRIWESRVETNRVVMSLVSEDGDQGYPGNGDIIVTYTLTEDDAVEIKRTAAMRLMGSAPELIRHYIELRGIGIVNVAKLFGMGAVRTENEINLIVNIVPWNTQEVYDRLGLEEQYMELLGVKVPMNTIPITPGRNLAMILEVAAMNNRQKKLGYNAALEFTEQVNQHFDENMGRNT